MSPRSGSTGPRGRSQRSRRTPSRPAASTAGRPAATARDTQTAIGPARPVPRGRSRFTGRAAVLVLVLAVLTVSYASSMRAYLQQRSSIDHLRTQIAQHEANIGALESEKKRWNDPAYVRAQARQRLGYVMPGEKSYLVLDEHGKAVQAQSTLDDPQAVVHASTPKPWWSDAWASVELAGNPPKPVSTPQPATHINGSHESTGG